MIVDMEDTSVSDQSPPPASVTPLTTELHHHMFFSSFSFVCYLKSYFPGTLNPLMKSSFVSIPLSLICFSYSCFI